jgi:2-dehydropantoate 2-reductase
MRIAILGSGGVGGYYGGRLAAAGEDVVFIARGRHLAAMRERGLRIESPLGNVHLPTVHATDDPTTVGAVDIVFFTVKLYDTEAALAMLPPLVGPRGPGGPGTLVVPFQNGVDSVGNLTRAVGAEHVAGGTTYIVSVVAEPGVIKHGALGRLVFGAIDGGRPAPLVHLLEACQRAKIEAVLSEGINVDIWSKFARLTVFSGMTSVARLPLGPLRKEPEVRALMEAALRESVAVGKAKGVPLPDSLVADIMDSLITMPPGSRSSMLEVLEHGRRLELPWLSGTMARLGKEVGVPTPIHQFIATILAPHVNGTPAIG